MACVGFADSEGKIHVFEEPTPYYGRLVQSTNSVECMETTDGRAIGRAWGDEAGRLFEVFVPDDLDCHGRSLAEMSSEELTEYRRRRKSAFRRFATWPQMNLVNLSTAIHRVAKIVGSDPWLQGQVRQNSSLETLLNSVCTALNVVEATEVQPQSVSNVVWSLATLRIVHRPLLQVISLVCVSNMAQFKSFELSTTLWALAKLGSLEDSAPVDKAVFYAAATHIHNNVNDFGFRCLATTAWAFATAKQRHARLFRSMAAAMLPAAAGANCQEMANTAWAFGTADFHDDALFQELAEQAIHRLQEFKPQEISNMLWGFATNSFFHEGFYARAGVVAQHMDLQSQHLANILWAFARVRPKHPLTQQTVLALLPVCTRQLATFKPQEVSSTLLATAKAAGSGDEMTPLAPTLENFRQEVLDFFHACLPWVVARLREFSEQSLANSVSAYAMVPVRGSETLVECAGQEVSKRMKDLDVNALVHLLKGFSLVPTSNSSVKIVKVLADSISAQLDKVRAQEMQSLGRLLSRGNVQKELDPEEIRKHLVSLAQNVQGVSDAPAYSQPGLVPLADGRKFQVQPVPQMNTEAATYAQVPMVQMNVVSEGPNFPMTQVQAVPVGPVNNQSGFSMLQQSVGHQQAMVNPMAQMAQGGNSGKSVGNLDFKVSGGMSGMGSLDMQAANLEMQAQMAMQDIFPQARRQQLSQVRDVRPQRRDNRTTMTGHEDDFLHQHPLCPISESGMMAAVMASTASNPMLTQSIGAQPPAVLPQGFRMDTAPSSCHGSIDAAKLAMASATMNQNLLDQEVYQQQLHLQAPPFRGVQDPMMMMPATSLAPAAQQVPDPMGADIQPKPATRNWENNHKLFVKNSFLHVQDSDEEEEDWNGDCNSSHRSSSMPSRMSLDTEDRSAYNRLPSSDMLELLYALRSNKPRFGDSEHKYRMFPGRGTNGY
eukprot:symbB.v1.2.005276.t4/scaffold305.1/size282400/5